jgi:hypothetical protein
MEEKVYKAFYPLELKLMSAQGGCGVYEGPQAWQALCHPHWGHEEA